LSDKFVNVYKKIESLDIELKDVKSENKRLKSEVLRLSGVVDQQKSELNDIEQYLRRDCVEILGLPHEKDENLNDLVLRLGSLMNVELHEDDISITHRLPVSRNENQRVTRSSANTFPKVIVKFTRRSTKEKFYHGRLRLKDKLTRDLGLSRISENKLFISESLSPRNKQLFKDCLKFKRENYFRYIWSYNGRFDRKVDST
jgi:hypothetical protein